MRLRISSDDDFVILTDEVSGLKKRYEKDSYYPKNNNDGTLSIVASINQFAIINSLPAEQWLQSNGDPISTDPNPLTRGVAVYFALSLAFAPAAAPTPFKFDFLNDVDETGKLDGDVFTWDNASSTYKPEPRIKPTDFVSSTISFTGNDNGPITAEVTGGTSPWSENFTTAYYTGSVNIGANTIPIDKLNVYGSGYRIANFASSNNAVQVRLTPTTGSYTNLISNTTGAFYVDAAQHVFRGQNSSNERMRIDSTGNVGIGTTIPRQKLHVDGNAQFSDGSTIGVYASETLNIGRVGGSSDATVSFTNANVGIGTTTPSHRLHVDGGTIGSDLNSTGNNTSRQVNMTSANTTGMNAFTAYNTNTDVLSDFLGKYGYKLEGGTATANKQFQVYVSDLSNPRMVVNGSGNVGIGTTGPAEKLHVSGGEVRVDAATTNQAGILVNNSTGNKTFELMNAGGPSYGVFNVYFNGGAHSDSQGAKVASLGTSYFNGGNVGIGTTSPSEKLHVDGSIRVNTGDRISMGGSGLSMFHSGTYAEAVNYTGDFIIRNTAANKDIVFKAEAGTGSDVEIMRIDGSSGNVGIGTTSPAFPLDIDDSGSLALSIRRSGTQRIKSDTTSSNGGFNFIGNTNNIWSIGAVGDNFTIQNASYLGDPSGYERVRIDSSGNVGIGTTSPSAKLDVVGFANINDGSNNVMISSGNTASITGVDNTTLGYRAAINLTSGNRNTAVGKDAFFTAATATTSDNTAVGHSALFQVTGDNNVGIGRNAGLKAATANVAVGNYSLDDNTGSFNVSVGYGAMGAAGSTASNTVAVGYQALNDLTTGDHNTAIGLNASDKITTGGYNVSLGNYALRQNQTASANTALGYGSAYETTSGNNTAVGYLSAYYSQTHNAALGARALNYSTGSYNVAVGSAAAQGVYGVSNYSNTVAVGYSALNALTTGAGNTAVGYLASNSVTNGSSNVSLGYEALNQTQGGNNNIAIGRAALNNNVGGGQNVAIGRIAGYSSLGSGNIFLGYASGYYETGNNKLYIANSDTTTPLIYGEFDNDILRVNGALQVGDPTGTGFALPSTDGTANQVLSTDGAGTVTWVDQSGGASTGAEIGFAYKTTDQTLTGTFTAISGFDGEFFDDLTSFDTTTGALTITDVGHYLINIDVMSNVTAGTGRSGSEIYLEFNGSEVAGSRRGMYNRNNVSGYTSASITFPYYHSTGTATFKVMAAQTSGTDTVIIDNCTFSYSTLGGTQGPQGVSGDAFAVSTEAAGRTLVAGDHLKYLRSTSATAVTFTVPPQSSVSWVDNAEIVFEQAGAGQITIAAGSGVTINSSETLKSSSQYAVIALKRVASDTWTLTGERELL